MKDYKKILFVAAVITLSVLPNLNAQDEYILVFRNVDKATFWLPIKIPHLSCRDSINDELRSRIRNKIDSCTIRKDTLTVYFNPVGLTVYLDTTTAHFYFGLRGMTNLKRNFSLSVPSCCTMPCDSINTIVVESFVTRYTFAKRGKRRYFYVGAKNIDIGLDYIKKHQFKVEYTTIRS
jgi:hypothetical protein